ncbi:hypothetical protein H7347_06070 [Corynebacterium sp. zg-331]|uniref:hypothetical protein n=1 Tax=unclassified Corynebacterium TaxID=2624378 RepID=UPI00128BDD20|nr:MULTISPECIES: hypothetical protein [unclassified Corynebacterium]MBC3186141.1 hypothetical protein [Corynebacterium sp. zg-331]MPV52631.1 hypothetical protein [Corynebacterium sp. zg331]
MSYADYVIRRQERLVDDEFERAMLHKASTVSLAYSYWLSLTITATLAWLLPGDHAYLSLVALLPALFSPLGGLHWLRRTTPRPRYQRNSTPECIAAVFIFIVICNGYLPQRWHAQRLVLVHRSHARWISRSL